MKRLELIKVEHQIKVGDVCGDYEPNITEDCIFYEDGEAIGFYISKMSEDMIKLADIANAEFRSNRVNKSAMNRTSGERLQKDGTKAPRVSQYSTILGSTPPRPHMRRPYPSISSIHSNPESKTFIRAMLMLAQESEELIRSILPEQFYRQSKLFEAVPDEWKFGRLFTSSISNYNISAPFHRDTGNIVGAVNVIITKRLNADGGNLHIPDYGATMDSRNNSILVYPAWKNIHGVTPIKAKAKGGYRNSLIFYPLKAFTKL
jgi:hypothetical protein